MLPELKKKTEKEETIKKGGYERKGDITES